MKFCPQCSTFGPDDATYCSLDGAELKPIVDPYLGRTIAARYRLVKRLGSGGMSSVYLAHHVMIERMSALKILREDLSRHPTHRERFLREARAVNRINHPNIVEISDFGESDGLAYLVMEFIDGPSLHQEINRGILPWPRAVRVGLQVAAALARAHQMGVVHRDLKPENILLGKRPRDALAYAALPRPGAEPEDHVKLTDFGIAKLMDEPALTLGEQLFGTPGYIAPESLLGGKADPRSDLYALGVILYEMTTGALPYEGQGAELLTAPLHGEPIPPSRRVPGFLPELEKLILHLLARSPDDRPADAFAVYDALVYVLRVVDDAAPVVSVTTSAARISFAGQRVREDAHTLVEASLPSGTPPTTPASVSASTRPPRQTSDLTAAAAIGTVRWHEALAQLESTIAVAQRRQWRPDRIERAVELATMARAQVRSIERVSRTILAQQKQVDALEAEGRSFRADIGRALDQLVLDRSRERALAEAASHRLASLGDAPGEQAGRSYDAALWETAALKVTCGSSEVAADDISFQIEALQHRLLERNLAHERDVVEASGALEGALAAARHLTHELDRLLEQASSELGEHSASGSWRQAAGEPGPL